VGARDLRARKKLLIDDEVDVLAVLADEVLEALVWEDEAEDEFEDLDELVLLLLLCVEWLVETAERKRSLNAILRQAMFFFLSLGEVLSVVFLDTKTRVSRSGVVDDGRSQPLAQPCEKKIYRLSNTNNRKSESTISL